MPLEIIFYTTSITILVFFYFLSYLLENPLGLRYGHLFTLLLLLVWVGEQVSVPESKITHQHNFMLASFVLGYGFWLASLSETKNKVLPRFKLCNYVLIASAALLLIASSLNLPFPYALLLNSGFAMLVLSHLYAANTWLTINGLMNKSAVFTARVSVVIILILLASVYLLNNSVSIHEQWVRIGFASLMLCTLFVMSHSVVALRKAHQSELENALVSAQTAESTAKELLDMEKAYIKIQQETLKHDWQFASASHDMKQPIASLRFAVEGIEPLLGTEQKRMFDRILGHLSDIANEFKISPASHLKAKASNEYINIAHLFTTLEQLFYDQAIEKGVMLHTEAVDIEVDAPAIIVLRILTNLVGNALEHSKAKDIVVNAKKDSAQITISVKDNGIGMTEPELDRYLLTGEKSESSIGEGMGLSVVKNLCEQFNFQLDVHCQSHVGCTFTFRLPCAGQ